MIPSDANKPLMLPRQIAPPDQTPVPGPLSMTSNNFSGRSPNAPPPGLATNPTVGALLLALKRRLPIAVCLAIVGALVSVAAVFVAFPAKFVALTRMELQSRPSRPMLNTVVSEAEVDPAVFRANQKSILISPLVLSQALNSDKLKGLKVTGQSAESLEGALKVDFAQGPEIMTVKLFGDQPEHLAEVLNAIVQAYIKEVDGRDSSRKKELIKQLEESKREYEKKLTAKRSELATEEKLAGIPDQKAVEEGRRIAAGKVQTTQTELRHATNELSLQKQDLATLKARLEKIQDEPISKAEFRKALNDVKGQNSHFMIHLKPLIDVQNAVDAEIVVWTKYLPGAEAKRQLEDLKKQRLITQNAIDAEELKVRGDVEKEIRSDRQEKLQADILVCQRSIARLSENAVSLNKELETHNTELKSWEVGFAQIGLTVQKLRDDEKEIKTVMDKLAYDVALLKVEPTFASRVTVLQPAETPTDRDYSRLIKMGGAAGFGMFGLVLFGVAFVEFRTRKINGVEEVSQGLGLHVIGTIPKLPSRVRRNVQATTSAKEAYWQGLISESVDAIRTQLLHAGRTDDLRIVMVTSAGGGEGKTSLASQLAASMARAWRKTLLIDGDLRNPATHKLFDLPLEPGFSEALRNEASLADVVKPTLLSRLWLMPAGHWDAHAVQALAQDGMRSMFNQLRDQYDFIIVDSCPVLPVADSLLLGQHVDGVLFSILRDVSRLPSVHAAQQKLQNLGVRTLGAVVIGAANDPGSLSYNYAARG